MRARIVAALVGLAVASGSARAASLQVSPVSIEVEAPGAAATLELRNDAADPVNAQIRVFRWTQDAGVEKLTPTDAVVASPPMALLAPGTNYTVRLVRLTKEPMLGGESYRVFVDELPAARAPQNRSVTLVVRYSIPVFFNAKESADAKVAWSIQELGGRAYLSATNDGDRHVRISALSIRDAGGKSISFGKGLTGYVLGRSTMRWAVPGKVARAGVGHSAVIVAETNFGPINAKPIVRPGP